MCENMPSQPLISVVIPAHNAESFLCTAIDSVVSQTYPLIEIIIVDDGSVDATAKLALDYQDARLIVLQKENGGAGSARNLGIEHAKGEYIAYLDADDFWMPDKLARQIQLMQENMNIGFTSTATKVQSITGEFLNYWLCPEVSTSSFLETLFLCTAAVAGSASSVMVRKDLQLKVGFFDESMRGQEDTDMWLRLSAAGEYACIPEVLTVVQKRPASRSTHLSSMRDSMMRMMKKNRHLLPAEKRGAFWRDALAGEFCDYAKWEARSGRRAQALLRLCQAFALSPIKRFRLCAALAVAIINPWASL
jgi:GT2 family glycosyltransferase